MFTPVSSVGQAAQYDGVSCQFALILPLGRIGIVPSSSCTCFCVQLCFIFPQILIPHVIISYVSMHVCSMCVES